MNRVVNFLNTIPKQISTLVSKVKTLKAPALREVKIPRIPKKIKIAVIVIIVLGVLIKTLPSLIRPPRRETDSSEQVKEEGEEVLDTEPIVFSWETYTNQTLNFQVSVPNGWEIKSYEPKDRALGKKILAFGPKKLPDNFVLAESYYAITVTPVANKQEFAKYKGVIDNIGKGTTSQRYLAGVRGADTGSFITVEHKGYIYELILRYTRNADGTFSYTETSQRVIDSFRFIDEQNAPNQVVSDIRVDNGNIITIDQKGKATIVVNKNAYVSEGIKDFSEVKVSPDSSLMCFIGTSVAGSTFIYYSPLDGKNPYRVAGGKNCVWSHNSHKIAFTNAVTDLSPIDIFAFNTETKETKNLTRNTGGKYIRFYEIPEWSQDDSFVLSNFTAFDPTGTEPSFIGGSVIDIATGEVTDK
ncbi:MAG: hypothetical protein ACD_52C00265G0001 [uncultured bacterium]|nr:MAG: hypothetical protein ACD_52C00265G0001 [uncultured bacterium]